MQARATTAEFESYQRSQAVVLIEDMTSRLNANRANAAAYVTGALIGDGAVVDCNGMNGAALDLCEWGNLVRGSAEVRGGRQCRVDGLSARLHRARARHNRPLCHVDRVARRRGDRRPDEQLRTGGHRFSHRDVAARGLFDGLRTPDGWLGTRGALLER